eukprot:gb/GEZN01014862.1/.p1 GENE.gb/GEZN01014862.1/~~gb/GEZN01014862.1/.p1  ORF type:complete len:149 (-),score=6.70 gb/GEZN01014862.1/:448-894(-)
MMSLLLVSSLMALVLGEYQVSYMFQGIGCVGTSLIATTSTQMGTTACVASPKCTDLAGVTSSQTLCSASPMFSPGAASNTYTYSSTSCTGNPSVVVSAPATKDAPCTPAACTVILAVSTDRKCSSAAAHQPILASLVALVAFSSFFLA